MAFPDTDLREDELDDEYGGRPADQFGLLNWKWLNSVVRVLSESYLTHARGPRQTLVVEVQQTVVPGDVCVALMGQNGTSTLHNIQRLDIALAAYIMMVAGVCVVGASAGEKATLCTFGFVPASATGIAPQSSPGPCGINTTTGRLRVASPGDVIIGAYDLRGNVMVANVGFLVGL